MTITITGRDQGRFVCVTRLNPASAIQLAARWVRDGYEDVLIGWKDRSFEPEAFRSQFVFTSTGLKLRPVVSR